MRTWEQYWVEKTVSVTTSDSHYDFIFHKDCCVSRNDDACYVDDITFECSGGGCEPAQVIPSNYHLDFSSEEDMDHVNTNYANSWSIVGGNL
jgi:hypothetical protein